MLRTSIISAKAALKSANVATSTLEAMSDTAERQLHAYVFLESIKLINLEGGAPVTAHIVIKNSGQTPAHNADFFGGLSFREYPLIGSLPAISEEKDSILTLPAGGMGTKTIIGQVFSAQQRTAWESGKYAFFVYGRIRYFDVFNKERITKIRFVKMYDPGISATGMIADEEGNEAT